MAPIHDYMTYLMSVGSSFPNPTPAETLRHLFTMGAAAGKPPAMPPPVANTVANTVANPPSTVVPAVKRKYHQIFREPLIVTCDRKIGSVPEGPIAYKEVEDPEMGDKYFLCGECDSSKLYRNLTSLYKHRVKGCIRTKCIQDALKAESVKEINLPHQLQGALVEDLSAGTEDELSMITNQAREFLGQKTFVQLIDECTLLGINKRSDWDTKADVIEAIIAKTLSVQEDEPQQDPMDDTQPVGAAVTMSDCLHDIPDLCSIAGVVIDSHPMSADVPPVSTDGSVYSQRMTEIIAAYPAIPPHLLCVLLLADICPGAKIYHDAEIQCRVPNTVTKKHPVYIEKSESATTTPLITERPKQNKEAKVSKRKTREKSHVKSTVNMVDKSHEERRSTRLRK
jgi:hypothetical protein